MRTPAEVMTEFIYVRFINERSIDGKDLGTMQRDRTEEMESWATMLKERKEAQVATVVLNKHRTGFGRGSANIFGKTIGLRELVWKEMKQAKPG